MPLLLTEHYLYDRKIQFSFDLHKSLLNSFEGNLLFLNHRNFFFDNHLVYLKIQGLELA